MFQYIKTHIQFAHPKFQNFAYLSHVQLFTWTFRTKPFGFHELLLLVLSFRLIPKSRNFVFATLFMFPCWAVPTVMMSSVFPTFCWLLHLYLLNIFESSCLAAFLHGPIGWMPHHWSTFLSFIDCSQKDFYLLLQTNRVLQNLVIHLILPFLYLEHLSKIFLGLGNCLKETSSQVQQLLVCCHSQCAPLDFTLLTYEMHHWNSIRPSII